MERISNLKQTYKDSELWDLFLLGDAQAFALLYQSKFDALYRFGFQLLADEERILDLIQDLFIKLYQSRETLKPVENVKTYLFISLKNLIYNEYKRQKGLDENQKQFQSSQITEEFVDPLLLKEDIQLHNAKISNLFAACTERQKEILFYRYVEGLSVKDISLLTNINSQSISNILYRALSKIKKNKKSPFK